MTPSEAVVACEFWTTNLAESQAIGSTTNDDVGAAFNSNVSLPRCAASDPGGARHWDVRVSRWISQEVDETGERVVVENPLYSEIAAEIERRASA